MARPSPRHSGNATLMALGEAIREARVGIGLSQETMALNADLDRSYVGGVERGENNITVMNLRKLATALDMKMSVLLGAAKP